MKNISKLFAFALGGVLSMGISACDDSEPRNEIETVKQSVTVSTQIGTLIEGERGTATYDVTTENIADGKAGAVTWYEAADSETAINTPSGIAASATGASGNAATVTITATPGTGTVEDPGAKGGVYYFRVRFDGVSSEVVTLTIGEPLPVPGEEYGIETVKIIAGTFLMGSPLGEPNREDGATDPRKNNEIQHEVTLT